MSPKPGCSSELKKLSLLDLNRRIHLSLAVDIGTKPPLIFLLIHHVTAESVITRWTYYQAVLHTETVKHQFALPIEEIDYE